MGIVIEEKVRRQAAQASSRSRIVWEDQNQERKRADRWRIGDGGDDGGDDDDNDGDHGDDDYADDDHASSNVDIDKDSDDDNDEDARPDHETDDGDETVDGDGAAAGRRRWRLKQLKEICSYFFKGKILFNTDATCSAR